MPGVLVEALNGVLPGRAIVMEEVTTNDAIVRERLARTELDTIHAIGAAGLGWAMGAAFGVKLAESDRDVVALCGDGSFMFCAPVAALWAARDAGATFLTFVFDNQGYRAAKLPVQSLFPSGAAAAADDYTGTVFAAPPDHAAVAHAERVTDPARLGRRPRRGLGCNPLRHRRGRPGGLGEDLTLAPRPIRPAIPQPGILLPSVRL